MTDEARKIADGLREVNGPVGKVPADIGWQNSPPGRTPETMDREQQELVLLAVEGMAAHLRGHFERASPGTEQYRQMARALGSLTTSANQIRRWLDARKAAEDEAKAHGPRNAP